MAAMPHARLPSSETTPAPLVLQPADSGDATRIGAVVLAGALALAAAMGIGRFAFTPVLPLMQAEGLGWAEGSALAAANYLGYLVGALLCMWRPVAVPQRAIGFGLVAVAVATAAMALPAGLAAWSAWRFAAGVASAYVLVGVSAWALPRLAASGRPAAPGPLYAGVGAGIAVAGAVGWLGAWQDSTSTALWVVLSALAALAWLVTARVWHRRPGPPPAAATPRPAPAGPAKASAGERALAQWHEPEAARLAWAYGAFGFGYIVPATFLPAMARELVSNPAVFGAAWPAFGLAAAASTVLAARSSLSPRRRWIAAQSVMAAGLVLPALSSSWWALLACAVAVGGTFMLVTMSGLQEARRVGGATPGHVMARLTAAFAAGQLLGPFTVALARTGHASPRWALAAAAVVLAAGAWALRERRSPAGPGG